jgi:hypothetical protein
MNQMSNRELSMLVVELQHIVTCKEILLVPQEFGISMKISQDLLCLEVLVIRLLLK